MKYSGGTASGAVTAVTIAVAVLVCLVGTSGAAADVKTFSPVAKKPGALVFKISGVNPRDVVEASATLRHRGGRTHRRSIPVARARRAARRGKLKVAAVNRTKGGKVTVVTRRKPAADRTPPETTITSGPADGGSTTSTSASFRFAGAGGVAGFECSLDGGAWSPCSSPRAYSGVALGPHLFAVRARDDAGRVDATPAGATWTVITQGEIHDVPSSVSGDCSTDVTSNILAWIASVPDGSTLRFGSSACYRVEGTLELRTRNLTIDGNGATFRSLDAPTDQRAIWRFWDSDVIVRNMSVVGSYANGGTYSAGLQHAHAIDLRGTHGVVENVTMTDLAGDCVYFGLGDVRSTGDVRDSTCRAISRNAVSVVAGDDVLVERVTTDRIGYIAFVVEPNAGGVNGSAGATFDSNTIGSYSMKAYTVIGNAPVSAQRFTNNRVVGQGLRIGVAPGSHRPRDLVISGNRSDTVTGNNALGIDGVDGLVVTGNTIPLTGGTMARVGHSCGAHVSGNAYPGGTGEVAIVQPAC